MKYQQAWPQLSEKQVRSAVAALKKLQLREDALWADDSPIQLLFSYQYLEDISKKLRPKLITVPHQILPEKTEVCLIVKNNCPQNLLQGLKSQFGKVLTITKLTRNYAEHEERRKLCGKFDLFLYDKHIKAGVLPSRVGKALIGKKKNPIAITVRSVAGVSNEVARVKKCAFYFKSGGVSTSIKVARLDFTDDEIVDNVIAVLNKMSTLLDPSSIQSISIKTPDSITLPIYQRAVQIEETKKIKTSVPPASSVLLEAETKEFEQLLDEALVSQEKRKEIFGLLTAAIGFNQSWLKTRF